MDVFSSFPSRLCASASSLLLGHNRTCFVIFLAEGALVCLVLETRTHPVTRTHAHAHTSTHTLYARTHTRTHTHKLTNTHTLSCCHAHAHTRTYAATACASAICWKRTWHRRRPRLQPPRRVAKGTFSPVATIVCGVVPACSRMVKLFMQECALTQLPIHPPTRTCRSTHAHAHTHTHTHTHAPPSNGQLCV